jgi:hypothetical protein
MSLRKRALVALSMSLSLVVAAATPAHASWNYAGFYGTATAPSGDWGDAGVYRESSTGDWAYVNGSADKSTAAFEQDISCTETWIDQHLTDAGLPHDHRAPDVFVRCRSGRQWFGPLQVKFPHYSMDGTYGGNGGFGPGDYVTVGNVHNGINANPDMRVCQLRVAGAARFQRVNDGNCVGSGVSVNPFNGRIGWIGAYGTTLQNMNDGNEPQHIRVDGIATLYAGQSMVARDLLVSIDGAYSARMQSDGNFVAYNNATGAALWAASWCGLTPIAGSSLLMQTDGNLVIYGPASNPGAKWASANINSCGGGSFGGSTPRLEMQTDSNLVIYNGASVLWDRY